MAIWNITIFHYGKPTLQIWAMNISIKRKFWKITKGYQQRSQQRSQRSPWLSSSCIMSAGSWISWCRPFIRLSGAQTGRNIPVMPGCLAKFGYPLNPPISWRLMGCTVEVPVHFFKPSHVFEMVLKKNSAKNRGVWSWYAPKFRGPWENVAVIMERTHISFKHHLPLFRTP